MVGGPWSGCKMTEGKYIVPEGKSGQWRVEYFTVSPDEAAFENMRAAFAFSARTIRAGRYMRLMRGNTVVMSDTPAEIADLRDLIWRCQGRVLINGLGLGVCANLILLREQVEHLTIIEMAAEVIHLVVPALQAHEGRFEVIHANALHYRPPKGVRFDVVWHDIWDNICTDNWEVMSRLHRKYGRLCGWQGSWSRAQVLRRRQGEKEV